MATGRVRSALRVGADAFTRGTEGAARAVERLGITPAGATTVVLVVLGWLAARLTGARAVYLLVYVAAVAVALAWFAARRRLALDVDRSDLPRRLRAGQVVEVQLKLRSRRRVSTIVVRETVSNRLGQGAQIPVASLRAGGEIERNYALRPSLRGVYSVGPCEAVWSDPFGLTIHRQTLAEPVEIIVHPAVERVDDRVVSRMWEDPPVRPPISKPWPSGFEFYGMRDYVPGDDLRRVVWSVVAKTGKMMVRESEQGITDRVVVFLDNDRDRHSPGQPSETFETAVRLAASLADRHLADGFSVSLVGNEAPLVKSARGEAARATTLDALARVQLAGASFTSVREEVLSAARIGAHIVVITPHLDSDGALQLRLAIERGASVVVAKILWDESDPLSSARAAGLGCQVVHVTVGVPLALAFSATVGAGVRR